MSIVVIITALSLFNADFSICAATDHQYFPCAIYQNNQYYVFWTDYRTYSSDTLFSLYGARISASGTVLDPNGKCLLTDSVSTPRVAFDGTNLLVVWREGC